MWAGSKGHLKCPHKKQREIRDTEAAMWGWSRERLEDDGNWGAVTTDPGVSAAK